MRIAQFIGTDTYSGAENVALQLAEAFAARAFDSYLICKPSLAAIIQQRCSTLKCRILILPDALLNCWDGTKHMLRYAFLFRSFLKMHNIDVLHSHLYKASVQNALSCFMAGVTHIATQHDSYTIAEKPSRAKWLSAAQTLGTQITAVSKTVAQDCLINNIAVIYNGLDRNRCSYVERIENSERPFTFITTGRVIEIKRIHYMIQAMKALYADYSNIELLIVGKFVDEAYRERLYKMIEEYACHSFIKFIGEVPDVFPYLKASDCYISASSSEGLSMSILEAMLSGLPVLVSNIPANVELIENSELQFEYSSNIFHLVSKMKNIINYSQQKRTFIGKSLRNKVLTEFHEVTMLDRYLRLYRLNTAIK